MSVGLVGLLGLLFIGLKLGHVIAWPWIWVLSPLWGSGALAIMALAWWVVVAVAIRKWWD